MPLAETGATEFSGHGSSDLAGIHGISTAFNCLSKRGYFCLPDFRRGRAWDSSD